MNIKKIAAKIFGQKEKPAEQPAAPVAEKSLYEIGLNGTAEEFAAALKKYKDIYNYERTAENRLLLVKGASEAFDTDRPENLMSLISPKVDSDIRSLALIMLCNKSTDHMKKCLEALSGEWKKTVLFSSACEAIGGNNGRYVNDPLAAFKNLIEAGLDIHQDQEWLLHLAAREGSTDAVKFLHEKGADFKTAIFEAEITGHPGVAKKLKLYQKHLTGIDADVDPKIAEFQQQMKELTEKVDRLLAQQAPAAAPAKPAADTPKPA